MKYDNDFCIVDHSMTKETPIEREIRLVAEREEEFRQHRKISSATSIDKDEGRGGQERPEASLTTSSASVNSSAQSVKSGGGTEAEPKPLVLQRSSGAISNSGHGGSPKDIQYEMATARLKREIEESLMRERELYREGRLKNISVSEVRISKNHKLFRKI